MKITIHDKPKYRSVHEEFILQVSKRKEEIFFLEAAEEYSSVLDGWNFG